MWGESRLFVRRAWRELLEHFVHSLVQVLNVLVGVTGERVARGASPDQLLGLGIKQIDNHSANFVRLGRGCGLAKTSGTEASPTPASTEAVIERIQGLLIVRDF